MQRPHRPVRVNKLPHVLQCRMHQCKVYIKRKLRVRRAQKCTFLVSAKTAPTGTGQQTAPCLGAPYWVSNRKIFKSLGLLFAMVLCLHQCKVYIQRKVRVWRAQKCNFLVSAKTELAVMGQQTTPCIASPCWASNRKFQNFRATYRHASVLTPMQCLYCKEAMGVESSKFQFSSQCKNRIDRYGSTN